MARTQATMNSPTLDEILQTLRANLPSLRERYVDLLQDMMTHAEGADSSSATWTSRVSGTNTEKTLAVVRALTTLRPDYTPLAHLRQG